MLALVLSIREGVWRKALVEAELATEESKLQREGLGTHVLRHTWATHRLQEGVPGPDVARALGHTLQTLLKTYAHAVPDENRDRLRVDLDAIV